MAVSTLTWALSFFVSDTYPRLDSFGQETAATLADGLERPADEADFFKQSREACRNEVEAMFDIMVGDDQIRLKMRRYYFGRPFEPEADCGSESLLHMIGSSGTE